MLDIQKRVRLLEMYTVVSLIIFGVLAFSAFTQAKEQFSEITVERLNIADKNGKLRMVMANAERMPDPIINGKSFKTERPPGIIFYNGLGDEDGGLIFGAASAKEKYGAYAGLLFDQYKQSQIIGLVYNDHSGKRQAGLSVWDRPEIPLSDLLLRREEIEKMPDGAAKSEAQNKLKEAEFSPTRVFVGKNTEHDAKVTLYDARGKARINMQVGADGTPKLEFMDENGTVIYKLPGGVKTN